ncbi:LOW QUALITY PROTEIN: small integral membrane protein 2-like [Trichechus inunguis]
MTSELVGGWRREEGCERTDASLAVSGEVETHGHAISILFGFWMSFICYTYVAFTGNSRIQSGCGIGASSDEPHTRLQQSRRQGHAKEDQNQVPDTGDILTLSSLDAAILIEPLYCSYYDVRLF